MQQLTQILKDGTMQVLEVPVPTLTPGHIMVRNHYSLISAGTEGSTVKAARASLIEKAKARPEQVKQVVDTLRVQGPMQTYRAVMKKLEAYSPLGYSSSGCVLEVGPGVEEFSVGDLVACAGVGYANHAEIVAVPVNLCVKLSPETDLRQAAYNTLGAIALQGVRQADLHLGETCAVIGLGLIGQLTCLILRASNIKVLGIDIDPVAVHTAAHYSADLAMERSALGVVDSIQRATNGLGVDAVIITAGSSSLDPVNFAGEIARKKGRVVIVGTVPTGFNRDPYWYHKELELKMSCSYGPGRYDPQYEERGIDYPAAYVRWTEKRNMEKFQDMLQNGRINVDFLTTHEVSLEAAPHAYDMIFNRSESFLGILIKYDVEKSLVPKRVGIAPFRPSGKAGICFVGAGSYAQGNLLPHLPKKDPDVVLRGIMTGNGTTSRRVAERFGFEFCTSDESDIFDSPEVNTVFVATRNDTHAQYVIKALQSGKNVFVEKPLCRTESELEAIRDHYQALAAASGGQILTVGFNRRFAPLIRLLKEKIGKGPLSMIYRVNAGAIPPESWMQDREIGGGRIIGEVCHFVDLLMFLNGSFPTRVSAMALPDPNNLRDTVSINLCFENGSIGSISYFTNGSKALPKEYLEVYGGGATAIVKDFKELEIFGKKRIFHKNLMNQDKGQKMMVRAFLDSISKGTPPPMTFEEVSFVTLTTFRIIDSLTRGDVVSVH